MTNPRNILNEIKWSNKFNLENSKIWYINRGSPNDTKIISGKDVMELEKSFMKLSTGMIPYHRITKITYNDDIIFQRIK